MYLNCYWLESCFPTSVLITWCIVGLTTQSKKMASGQGPIDCLIWFLLLLFVSPWIACFCFAPYVISSCLEPCIGQCREIMDFFLRGVQFPHACSENLVRSC